MKTMTVGEFKTNFSEVMEQVKAGISIAVTFGRKKEVIGYFVPENKNKPAKRKLGIVNANVVFKDDFEMSDEEFLGL